MSQGASRGRGKRPMMAAARAGLLDDLRRVGDRLIEFCTGLVRVPSENPHFLSAAG